MSTWDVQGDYGHGWETVTAEETYEAAESVRELYDAEESGVPHRVVEGDDDEQPGPDAVPGC